MAQRERFALIIDAKVRSSGYILGTEDRKFLDYAVKHGRDLQQRSYEKLYLVVVGPSFRESDLTKFTAFLANTLIRSVTMLTARALMRIVEDSIKGRSRFSLSEIEKQFFGHRVIRE